MIQCTAATGRGSKDVSHLKAGSAMTAMSPILDPRRVGIVGRRHFAGRARGRLLPCVVTFPP
jgi:hypothetical protein